MAVPTRRFLFLQGPTNLLFAKVAARLRALGHEAHRIHVCAGDHVFWRGPGAVAFRGRAQEWPAFIAAFYERHRITDLVLLGEKRERHRAAIEEAHRRGIAVTVTDFGYLRPDWIVVERDGLNGDSRFPRDAERVRALAEGLPPLDRRVRYPHRPAVQAAWDMAFHLSTTFWPWRYPHFRRHTLNSPVLNYIGTGTRWSKAWLERRRAREVAQRVAAHRHYLFAMQMEDDYSLRAYSTYPDLDSAMREVLASFAAHAPAGSHLVFKVHPLDPGLKDWRARIAAMAAQAGVHGRAHYIDGGDLDALIGGASGLLTVNSTAGLRALELGCPTLVLGQAAYAVEGLVFGGALDAFWNAPRPDAALADATLRALAASLHVRGSMYDRAGIEAAADGMAWRLHHARVNEPLAEVLRGEVPRAEPPLST